MASLDADLEKEVSVVPPSGNYAASVASLSQDEEKPGILVGTEPLSTTLPSDIVTWDGPDDPENPQNFSRTRKWAMTMSLALLVLTITFASSVFSTADVRTAEQFNVSEEVTILATSLFLVGFGIGPMIFAPLSELYGRKRPLMIGFLIFAVFQIPVAVAQNLETIMICRFLQGIGGAAMPAVIGGTLADFWDPRERGFAMPSFAAALFAGPTVGPIIGSATVSSHLGWRWIEWFTLIMAVAFGLVTFILLPETYGPLILTRRASRLRHQTKNWALHSLHEEREIHVRDITDKYLLRPAKMLVLEPILLFLTIYMGFVFGLLYLFFESYPIAFIEKRHMTQTVASTPFISLLIGVLMGCAIPAFTTRTWLAPDPKAGRTQETRLILVIFGGIWLPIGLFWFAWTASPSISPWPQIIAGVPVGFGVILINLQALNYIIDCYTINANSAIAANTLVRSFAGAGFPLFANSMYHSLGVSWATSVLAFIGVALVPVPIIFYKFGAKIRTWSRYVPE